MSTVPKVPVPTGDALMAVVAQGAAVCARWRETFLSWEPRHAVPQIVMNALDPALLEFILGPGDNNSLVRMLRAHYADVRERFPGPFADVEQVWRIQRAWWMQFVEADDAEASSAALAETFATLDVLLPHPAGALYLRGQRPARRAPPVRKTGPTPAASPAAVSGVRPARAGSAPVAGEQGHMPEGRRQVHADADSGVQAGAAASAAASAGSGSGGPVTGPSKPRAQPAATPARPRVTGGRSAAAHRPAPVTAAAAASSTPGVRIAPAAAHSPARAGRVSMGRYGRKLIEAAYVSYDHARQVTDDWYRSSPDLVDLGEWRMGTTEYERMRARAADRNRAAR